MLHGLQSLHTTLQLKLSKNHNIQPLNLIDEYRSNTTFKYNTAGEN